MRIVKSTQTIEFICVKCGSILEVEPTDVRTSDGEHSRKTWFTCPVCGEGNSLDGRIPESWIPIIYKMGQSNVNDEMNKLKADYDKKNQSK